MGLIFETISICGNAVRHSQKKASKNSMTDSVKSDTFPSRKCRTALSSRNEACSNFWSRSRSGSVRNQRNMAQALISPRSAALALAVTDICCSVQASMAFQFPGDSMRNGPDVPFMAHISFPFRVSSIGKHRVLTLDSVSMGIPAELRAALHFTAGFMSVKRVPSISPVSFFSLSRRAL